jgi:hypothetical protein
MGVPLPDIAESLLPSIDPSVDPDAEGGVANGRHDRVTESVGLRCHAGA